MVPISTSSMPKIQMTFSSPFAKTTQAILQWFSFRVYAPKERIFIFESSTHAKPPTKGWKDYKARYSYDEEIGFKQTQAMKTNYASSSPWNKTRSPLPTLLPTPFLVISIHSMVQSKWSNTRCLGKRSRSNNGSLEGWTRREANLVYRTSASGRNSGPVVDGRVLYDDFFKVKTPQPRTQKTMHPSFGSKYEPRR